MMSSSFNPDINPFKFNKNEYNSFENQDMNYSLDVI
jgi:hypothetical protein